MIKLFSFMLLLLMTSTSYSATTQKGLLVDSSGNYLGTVSNPLHVTGGSGGGNGLWETNNVGIDTFNAVGIGSTNPGVALDVNGSVRSLQYTATGLGNSQFYGNVSIGTNTAPGLLTITNSNVGIGTTLSTNALDIATGGVAIGTLFAGNVNAPSNGLIVQGNVGIGTNQNAQALWVNGNFVLPPSTHSNLAGIIYKNGSTFISDFSYGLNSFSITPQGQNTFIGLTAGNLTTGSTANGGTAQSSFNTAVGYNSMSQITTGNLNTTMGQNTGDTITTGGANTLIGEGAQVKTASDSNEIVIGEALNGNGPGTTTIGNSSQTAFIIPNGNIGIGSLTPGQNLDVQGTIRFTQALINTKSSVGIGWSEHNATNQACNTTCGTSACVIGLDIGTVGVVNSGFVACTDATADDCICAGP